MTIRAYRPSDFDRVCQIDRLCFPARLAYRPAEMQAVLGQPGALALVAEHPRQGVVAFVAAGRGHIVTVDVLPGHRRRGLARRLLRGVERHLRRAGVGALRLETSVTNRAALALYLSLGYAVVRRLRRYYPDGQDAWRMEKRLQVRA